MFTHTITGNGFYKDLGMRSTDDGFAKFAYGIIPSVYEQVGRLLEYSKETCPTHTDHGISHSLRILDALYLIVPEENKKDISSLETFFLILACIFHDSGMIRTDKDVGNSDDEIRKDHAKRSSEIFEQYTKSNLGILTNDSERIFTCMDFIMSSHQMNWEDMIEAKYFKNNQTFGNQTLRVKLICILLRIGDLLDLDSDRIPPLIRELKNRQLSTKGSLDHFVRHREVSSKLLNSDTIQISIEATTRETHKIWENWLGYLKNDIYKANTHVFVNDLKGFRLPKPELEITKAEGAKYILWPLKFDLDDKSGLWDIISRSIYTNRFDFVREVVQNSIDATLLPIFLEEQTEYISLSPRSWYEKCKSSVRIYYSERNKILRIVDNGIGMDFSDLERFLFKVSSSGFGKTNKNEKSFPSIAKFGIGFVSLLSRSTSIEIHTRKNGNKSLICSIDSKSDAVIVEESDSCHVGTMVSLTLDNDFDFKELETYMCNTFVYPSVQITLLNQDELENNIDAILEESEKKSTQEQFNNYFNENFLWTLRHKLVDYCNTKVEKEGVIKSLANSIINIAINRKCEIPIKEPIATYFSEGFEIYKTVSGQNIRRTIDGATGIISIPVEYQNLELGIEWCSLHTFLFIKDSLTHKIVLINGFLSPDGDVKDYMVSSIDEFEEVYESENDNGLDELIYKMSNGRDRQREREINIQHLTISQQGLTVNVNDESVPFFEYMLSYKGINDYTHSSKNTRVSKTVSDFYAFEKDFTLIDSHFCQDGIRIALDPCDIVPIGYAKSRLNLTADARLKLSASRHSVDESQTLLNAWMENYGREIQKAAVEQICKVLKEVNLAQSIKPYIFARKADKNIFSGLAATQLNRIISEYNW